MAELRFLQGRLLNTLLRSRPLVFGVTNAVAWLTPGGRALAR
jgi:hypothetical protein